MNINGRILPNKYYIKYVQDYGGFQTIPAGTRVKILNIFKLTLNNKSLLFAHVKVVNSHKHSILWKFCNV